MRPLKTVGLTVLALLSCVPTEPCACRPALGLGIVFGTVADAAGRAVPAVTLRVEAFKPDCAGVENPLVDNATTTTDGAGKYRYALRALVPADEGCVVVTALSSDAAVLASATARLRLVPSYGVRDRPDSVRLDLRLP